MAGKKQTFQIINLPPAYERLPLAIGLQPRTIINAADSLHRSPIVLTMSATNAKKRSNDVTSESGKQKKFAVDGSNDIETPLEFEHLIGGGIQYDYGGDKSKVCSCHKGTSAALSNVAMTSGKHYVTFERDGDEINLVHVGIMRPLKDLKQDDFSPLYDRYEVQRTPGDSSIHCCMRLLEPGKKNGLWTDGKGKAYDTKKNKPQLRPDWGEWESCKRENVTLGMLLDMDAGTLTVYENGRNLGVLKDGLRGKYCWAMEITDIADGTSVHLKRGAVPTK